jgi:hypothetical protein
MNVLTGVVATTLALLTTASVAQAQMPSLGGPGIGPYIGGYQTTTAQPYIGGYQNSISQPYIGGYALKATAPIASVPSATANNAPQK